MPDPLTLALVGPVIRIVLLFFPLPFALSCPLTSLGSAILLVIDPLVPWQNPPATGASKCAFLHSHLRGLRNVLVKNKKKKKLQRKKLKKIHLICISFGRKKKKNKEEDYLGGISAAHFVDFYAADFGWEVNRWFHKAHTLSQRHNFMSTVYLKNRAFFLAF